MTDQLKNSIRKSYQEEQEARISENVEFIVMVTGCSKYEAELALENTDLDVLEVVRRMKTN